MLKLKQMDSTQQTDFEGNTDLHLASVMGHEKLVYLCDFTEQPNNLGATPLMLAC